MMGSQFVVAHCTFASTSLNSSTRMHMAKTRTRKSIRTLRKLDGYRTSPGLGDASLELCGCPKSSKGTAPYCCPSCDRAPPASRGKSRPKPKIVPAHEASTRMMVWIGLSKAKVVGMLRESRTVPMTRPLMDAHFVPSMSSCWDGGLGVHAFYAVPTGDRVVKWSQKFSLLRRPIVPVYLAYRYEHQIALRIPGGHEQMRTCSPDPRTPVG